jgi:hypothetical protein
MREKGREREGGGERKESRKERDRKREDELVGAWDSAPRLGAITTYQRQQTPTNANLNT